MCHECIKLVRIAQILIEIVVNLIGTRVHGSNLIVAQGASCSGQTSFALQMNPKGKSMIWV